MNITTATNATAGPSWKQDGLQPSSHNADQQHRRQAAVSQPMHPCIQRALQHHLAAASQAASCMTHRQVANFLLKATIQLPSLSQLVMPSHHSPRQQVTTRSSWLFGTARSGSCCAAPARHACQYAHLLGWKLQAMHDSGQGAAARQQRCMLQHNAFQNQRNNARNLL